MKRAREQDDYTQQITDPGQRSGKTLADELLAGLQKRASLAGITVTCDTGVVARIGEDHMIQRVLLERALAARMEGRHCVHFVLSGSDIVCV